MLAIFELKYTLKNNLFKRHKTTTRNNLYTFLSEPFENELIIVISSFISRDTISLDDVTLK